MSSSRRRGEEAVPFSVCVLISRTSALIVRTLDRGRSSIHVVSTAG